MGPLSGDYFTISNCGQAVNWFQKQHDWPTELLECVWTASVPFWHPAYTRNGFHLPSPDFRTLQRQNFDFKVASKRETIFTKIKFLLICLTLCGCLWELENWKSFLDQLPTTIYAFLQQFLTRYLTIFLKCHVRIVGTTVIIIHLICFNILVDFSMTRQVLYDACFVVTSRIIALPIFICK